jgi:hypothetical protein
VQSRSGLALVGLVPAETLAIAVAASGEEFEFFDPLLGIIRAALGVAEYPVKGPNDALPNDGEEIPHLSTIRRGCRSLFSARDSLVNAKVKIPRVLWSEFLSVPALVQDCPGSFVGQRTPSSG